MYLIIHIKLIHILLGTCMFSFLSIHLTACINLLYETHFVTTSVDNRHTIVFVFNMKIS